MPQFEFANYTGQIFWMLISFGILFLCVNYFIFPLFKTIFSAREIVIKKHLKQAEKINQEAEKLAQNLQERNVLTEKKLSFILAKTRTTAQENMRDALTQNRKQCNQHFKKALGQLQTVEQTLTTAMNDWITNLQNDFITKTNSSKERGKCKI